MSVLPTYKRKDDHAGDDHPANLIITAMKRVNRRANATVSRKNKIYLLDHLTT